MAISFEPQKRVFKLDSGNATYAFLIDSGGYPSHLYFGPKLETLDLDYLHRPMIRAFSPVPEGRPAEEAPDAVLREFATHGVGDYALSSAVVRDAHGNTATDMRYRSHRILRGKPKLPGLPATFGSEEEVETLELTLADEATGVEFILAYSTFRELPVIARSVRVVNRGTATVQLEKIGSALLDFDHCEFEFLQLWGAWGRERVAERTPLRHGIQAIASNRGLSSHQHNPFFALVEPGSSERFGWVYGMALLYSGNFRAEVEVDQGNRTRAQIGINPEDFEWELTPGAEFVAPEAVLVFSDSGLGAMSRAFHDLFRNHLIRSRWRDRKRPLLINNWEGTFFDFDQEKILAIAREAAALGLEMLVLDDGWFGARDDDRSSLGDWFVYERKLPSGIDGLAREINRLGLKFGLWFEPEMISRRSRLYEQHPDWCLHLPDRGRSEGRNQLVLDMSRPEVVDEVFRQMSELLDHANIEYIKWDANRHLTEVGSAVLPPGRQKEVFHRFVLGTYDLHERLLERYPELLIEGCSGGGGRFDAGMLYYAPQIWTSDNTDAIDRLRIQYGTSLVYPGSTMGAHVSDCRRHPENRQTPFPTRGVVAMAGTFGYELDLTRMNEEERAEIRRQVRWYHQYHHLVEQGQLYRLRSDFDTPGGYVVWAYVSPDRREVLLSAVQPRCLLNEIPRRVRLDGLAPELRYCCDELGRSFLGNTLMNAGAELPLLVHDGDSCQLYFHAEEE